MQIQILVIVLCGILSVKASPLDVIKEAVKAVEADKSSESVEHIEVASLEASDSLESAENDSVEKLVANKVKETRPLAQATNVVVQTLAVLQPIPIVTDVSRKVGPVELGLRNVVGSSAAATEEIFLEMTTLNAETSHMINSKAEIMAAQVTNEIFEPLTRVENEIKVTGSCGKRYETVLNIVFKDIDVSLKECSKNLTAIDEQYRSKNVGSLTSLSIVAEEMNSLPESCGLADNFAVGTFCVINNLAEMNQRVIEDVQVVKLNTKTAVEDAKKEVEVTAKCHEKLLVKVSAQLEKLHKEVNEKCIEKKQ